MHQCQHQHPLHLTELLYQTRTESASSKTTSTQEFHRLCKWFTVKNTSAESKQLQLHSHLYKPILLLSHQSIPQQQHNVTQPQHKCWVGHENDFANPTTPPTPQKLNSSLCEPQNNMMTTKYSVISDKKQGHNNNNSNNNNNNNNNNNSINNKIISFRNLRLTFIDDN